MKNWGSALLKTTRLVRLLHISIFSAMATVVMLFKIPVFFVPGFYKLDVSDAIVLISGFSLGPLAGLTTEALKILLFILIKGSSSLVVGQFADFIMGIALVLPSAIIYKKYRIFKGAVFSMIVGIFSLIIISSIVNYFLLIPLYEKLFSISEDSLVELGNSLNPFIIDKFTFVLFATCPFNLLKGVIVCAISLVLYKKLTATINKISRVN